MRFKKSGSHNAKFGPDRVEKNALTTSRKISVHLESLKKACMEALESGKEERVPAKREGRALGE